MASQRNVVLVVGISPFKSRSEKVNYLASKMLLIGVTFRDKISGL